METIDALNRIIAVAEKNDIVMLPRATVYALCKCAFTLQGATVALQEYSASRFTGGILRTARESLQLLEAVSQELGPPVPHITGLDDLRDAS